MLYPAAGFTKGEVIDYYARVGDAILPHLRGRACTRVRLPDGVEGQRFFEKRAPSHTPDWVRTAGIVMGREGELNFVVCDDRPTLVWLAQLAALELHPSLSLVEDYERPTVLAFDLDPGAPANIVQCCRVALQLRGLFGQLGMECVPKTSGSKGLQVYVPLNSPVTYEDTKSFAREVAQTMEGRFPDRVTSKMAKDLRPGKVFIDWSQNDRAKTTVSVYSLRAREHPTVSTPLRWEEVERGARSRARQPLRFTARDLLRRLEQHGDLFAPVLELRQKLPER